MIFVLRKSRNISNLLGKIGCKVARRIKDTVLTPKINAHFVFFTVSGGVTVLLAI